jgi:hypothetical protein
MATNAAAASEGDAKAMAATPRTTLNAP